MITKRRKIAAGISLAAVLLLSTTAPSVHAASYSFGDMRTWETVGTGYTTSGGFVGNVQALLWSSGYSSTVGTVDQVFGTGTKNGVKSFQTANGVTSDGVVGNGTYAKFENYTTNTGFGTRRYQNTNSTTYLVDFRQYPNGTGGDVTYNLINYYTNTFVAAGTIYSY